MAAWALTEVTAEAGDYLSFATMFVQSNDLFYAPSDRGIALFPNGLALEGDITDLVELWDAGTEFNEPVRLGGEQFGTIDLDEVFSRHQDVWQESPAS